MGAIQWRMRVARPSILWRATGWELWRLLVLTLVVLLVVIGFGVAVRPLAEGKVGVLDALKILGMATVAMLQYAAPFAACFAATLAYHRMASDNEAIAAHAGGVSHRSLLVPALLTALALGLGVAALADQVVPRMLRRISEIVVDSGPRLLENSVRRGTAFALGDDRTLWADAYREGEVVSGATGAPGAGGAGGVGGVFKHFQLAGVVFVDRRGEAKGGEATIVSARSADVWLVRDSGGGGGAGRGADGAPGERTASVRAVMRLNDFIVDGRAATGEGDGSVLTFPLESAFRMDPKYLTFGEMQQAKERLETLPSVDERRRDVARMLGEREIGEQVNAQLAKSGRVELTLGDGRRVVLRASGVSVVPEEGGLRLRGAGGNGAGGGGGPVEVDVELGGGGQGRRHTAQRAWLALAPAPEGELDAAMKRVARSYVRVRMEDVVTTTGAWRGGGVVGARVGGAGNDGEPEDRGAGEGPGVSAALGDVDVGGRLKEYTLGGLRLANDPLERLLGLGVDELIEEGAARAGGGGGDGGLENALNGFREEVRSAQWEIVSKQHERIAASLACVLTIMLGAVMGLRLREQMVLTVYAWAFVPALAAVLSVSGGQRLVNSHGWIGFALLYGGVVGLALLTLKEYRTLARH